MTARTHDAFAFASLITVATLVPTPEITMPTLVTAIVANIVGALIPDMDQAGNRLWDLLPAGNFMGKVFRRIFISHRSISHSLLGGYILYRLLVIVLPILFNTDYINLSVISSSIMIGFISHLVADAMTKDGIPLFFPIPWKVGIPPIEFLRVRTGSWVENFVVLPLVGVYILWFISNNQEPLLQIIKSIKI